MLSFKARNETLKEKSTPLAAGGGVGDERVLHWLRHHAPRRRQDLPVPQLVKDGGRVWFLERCSTRVTDRIRIRIASRDFL